MNAFFRWVLYTVLVLAVLATAAHLGGRIWLRWYLESEDFALDAREAVYDATGVKGRFLPFRWDNRILSCDGFRGTGDADGGVEALDAEEVRIRVATRGWIRRTWWIESVDIKRVGLRGSGVPRFHVGAQPQVVHAGVSLAFPMSEPMYIQGVYIANFHAAWRVGGKSLVVKNLVVKGAPEGVAWRAVATQGILHYGGSRPATVKTLDVRWKPHQLDVLDAHVDLAPTAFLRGMATVVLEDLYPMKCTVSGEGIPLSWWVGDWWREKVMGTLSAEATMDGPIFQPDEIEIRGAWNIQGGALKKMPILRQIAVVTKDPQYDVLPLGMAKGSFEQLAGKWSVRDVVMHSEGWLRVEGGLTGHDDLFEGRLLVGLPPEKLRWVPGARQQVFTVARDGFLWTPMNIRGMQGMVEEDLSARIIEAAGDQIVEDVRELLDGGMERASEVLQELFNNSLPEIIEKQ